LGFPPSERSLHLNKNDSNFIKALRDGIRHIDTSLGYGNQAEVGYAIYRAISDKVLKRENLFITTKVCDLHHDRIEKGSYHLHLFLSIFSAYFFQNFRLNIRKILLRIFNL